MSAATSSTSRSRILAPPRRTELAAFGLGLLFAVGLGISGMTLPDKVIGFLDFFGDWDPALMFVMGGAVMVYGLLFPLIKRRSRPLLAQKFWMPTRRDLDARLIGGAALFGIGWGLGGFCPGPGLVSVASGTTHALVFVAAMAVAMVGFNWVMKRRQKPT